MSKLICGLSTLVVVASLAGAGPAPSWKKAARRVERGEKIWKRSCRKPGADGACIAVRQAKAADHCEQRAERLRSRRADGRARRAKRQLEAALARLTEDGALEELSEDDAKSALAAAARARFYLAEPLYEEVRLLGFPTKLDFDPKKPEKAKRSKESFMKWLEAMKTRTETALKAYREVGEDAGAPAELRVAARARIGDLFRNFTRKLRYAEIPLSVRSGKYKKTKVDAFCDQLETEAKPLAREAEEAYRACAELASALGVDNDWSRRCAARAGAP